MFTRIAVVNRGEPAVRLVRAVRELNEEHGYGIKVIALHTPAEQRALFVRLADESVCLRAVESPRGPYLDHVELERALRVSRADAVWVGWGFVAEDAAFADLCEQLGMVFIGPPAQVLRQLGADSIGMSTVLEAIQARTLGLEVAAFSCLTNWAAGIGDAPLSHEEVLETGKSAAAEFARLLNRALNNR